MSNLPHRRSGLPLASLLAILLVLPVPAEAGKLSWLDDVVREIVVEAKSGGKATVRGAGRLFVHEAEEGLEIAAKRSEDLARIGRRVEQPSEALLQARFSRLLRHDPEAVRTFGALAPAEKRLVVEMGETAQRLARRYPDQAETMIRKLGTEGLSAVRVFGDDVAEILVKEGPESLGVLRKTGRGGWSFFTHQVLPHKKKLAAAGRARGLPGQPREVCRLRGPGDRVRRPRVRPGRHPAGRRRRRRRGQGARIDDRRDPRPARSGLRRAPLPRDGRAGLVVVLATMVLLGIPVRWVFRPLFGIAGLFRRHRHAKV